MFRFIRYDENLGWTGFDEYFAYLASIEHRLEPALYAFVSDRDRYFLSSKKSLHDAWLKRLILAPANLHEHPVRMTLELELLGPYHDRMFRLRYDEVLAYSFDQRTRSRRDIQDLLVHEFRLGESGLDAQGDLLEHVFEFDDDLYLRVASRGMSFEEVMLDACVESGD